MYISTPTIIAAALALNSPVNVNRIKPRDWVKLKMLNVGEDRVMFAHSSLFLAIWRIQNGITSLSYALLCICNFFFSSPCAENEIFIGCMYGFIVAIHSEFAPFFRFAAFKNKYCRDSMNSSYFLMVFPFCCCYCCCC